MRWPDLVLAAGGICIAVSFAWAVRGHFSSTAMPRGMQVVTAVSTMAGLNLVALGLAVPGPLAMLWLGVVLQWLAFGLFVWAVRASRGHGLRLAFDLVPTDIPVLARGPYRFVRHPFYLAYSLFWLGWALGVGQALGFLPVLVLVGVYVMAARREEAALLAGPCGDAYRRYRDAVGAVLPKATRHAP